MASPRYLNGVVWSGANACAAVVLPFAIYIFFARTVAPELIGAVALSVSCVEILKAFALPGLYEALLQQKTDQVRCHETASLILLSGAAALLAAYLTGLLALSLLSALVATNVIAFAALGARIMFDLAALQPQARLAQRLSFGRLAARGMVGNCAGGVMGVGTALATTPFAGLIVYQVSQSLMMLLTTVIGNGAMAWPRLHRDCLARMWRESSLSTGVRLLAATINNLDQIIVAALTGSVPLAFYNLGKRIETTFVTTAGSFVAILFQPLFAHARPDARSGILGHGVAVLTAVLGFPAAAFIANSRFLVTTVFGDQWAGASTVAAVLAAGGFARAIGFVPGALMSVSMRNRELLLTSLGSAAAGAVLVAVTAPFGIVWCAAALLFKQAGIVGWMAALLRNDVADPALAYFSGVIAPFLLMLAGTLAGRWIIGDAALAQGIVHQFMILAASLTPGAALGAAYFAVYFRRELGGYYGMLRGRWTAQT